MGPLGLTFDEFWKITPREVFYLCEGYSQELELKRTLIAWHAAIVVSPHVKKPPSVDDLLGKKQRKKDMNPLEMQQEFNKLEQQLAERRKQKDGRGYNRNHVGKDWC